MASRVRQMLGVEVNVTQFFDHPALTEFARTVKDAARSELPPITKTSRDEPLALSFAQQRLWFQAQMEGSARLTTFSLGCGSIGPLDRDALRRALNRLVARHEVLRTTFIQVDDQPVQRIAAAEESGFALRTIYDRAATRPENSNG